MSGFGLRTRAARLKNRFAKRVLGREIQQLLLADPRIAAKFYPYEEDQNTYFLPKKGREDRDAGSDFQIPPRDLWVGSGGLQSVENWLAFGQRRVERMKQALAATGFELRPEGRVLDFGCSTGNMIRFLKDQALSGEVWGIDIMAELVIWCMEHLSPPFKFATTTSFPHLPFEDRYFDLVYAGSVFTHIADLAEAWLLELRRIVRPGGRLFLTVHDSHYIKLALEGKLPPRSKHEERLRSFDEEYHFTSAGFSMFSVNRIPGPGGAGEAQVYYDTEYLRQHWGNYLKVISIVPEAMGPGAQTAVILEK